MKYTRHVLVLAILLIPSVPTFASTVSINFDSLPIGTVLTNQYGAQGVQFNGATIFDPSSISNPPSGNSTNFILPSSGYNANGSFSISFIDPVSLFPITTPSVTFTAYLGLYGEVFDTFDVTYERGTGSGAGPISYKFYSNQTFTISDSAGIQSISFQDWGVNAFDNFEFDLTVTPIPIPAAVWLFGSGLLGLIGFSKRKKAA